MKLIECPRDAMQGIAPFIPTELKARYINELLKVGFDTIDFGSFVSPKAIPQLRDTSEVLAKLNLDGHSKLLAIIANTRGAQEASRHEEIHYLGFPLSISETFQKKNTNKTISEAFVQLNEIQEICVKNEKTLVTYISMGFGNPYNDPYNPEVVSEFIEKLVGMGNRIISLADTIGISNPKSISSLFTALSKEFNKIELGVHLHSHPDSATEKIEAAYQAGCKRFDGAIRGFGGCPMAEDELVGNIATEKIVEFLVTKGELQHINKNALQQSLKESVHVFN